MVRTKSSLRAQITTPLQARRIPVSRPICRHLRERDGRIVSIVYKFTPANALKDQIPPTRIVYGATVYRPEPGSYWRRKGHYQTASDRCEKKPVYLMPRDIVFKSSNALVAYIRKQMFSKGCSSK